MSCRSTKLPDSTLAKPSRLLLWWVMLRGALRLIPALLCLLPGGTQAAAQTLHLVAYSTGLRVLEIHATLALGADRYRADLAVRTVGVLSLFLGGRTEAVAYGTWHGDAAAPAAYDVDGRWEGETLLTRIDYIDGRPDVRALLPEVSREREAVPQPLQANTIDSLSAMAALVHRVNTTGRCDGAARVFDGRRLSQITVETVGTQVLPPTDRSSFSGPALRCDFDGRLLAGFKYDDNRARAARPRHGVAWLARLSPDGPMVPVRLQFDTPFFEDVTMYLQP